MADGCSTANLITGDNTISGAGKTWLLYGAVNGEMPVGYCLRTLSVTDNISLRSDNHACGSVRRLTQGLHLSFSETASRIEAVRQGVVGGPIPQVDGIADIDSKTETKWFAMAYSDFSGSGTLHAWHMENNTYYTDDSVDADSDWLGLAIYVSLGTSNEHEMFMAEAAIVDKNLSLAELTGWARGLYPPFNTSSSHVIF